MSAELTEFAKAIAIIVGAEAVNITALLPNGDRLGTNLIAAERSERLSPGRQAALYRRLAEHLRYCAKKADRAARAARGRGGMN